MCLQHVVLYALTAAIGALAPSFATADYHLMQIEQVIAGVRGDTTAQAIQLRMRSGFQNNLATARMRVFDANGQNPIVVVNFDGVVPNFGTGDRVLITSAAFNSLTTPTAEPDFAITNLIPESYLAAGSLTFESDFGVIWWRLSWGGEGYVGSNGGSAANDNDGDFGPPWPGALPSEGVQALRFEGGATAMSATNEMDYSLTDAAPTFVNNARESFLLNDQAPIDCPLSGYTVNRGTRTGGNLQSLIFSDPFSLKIASDPGDIYHTSEITVKATSKVLNPSRLDLQTETRANATFVQTRISLRDVNTNTWVLIGSFAQPQIDTVKIFADIADPSRFIRQSDGLIRVRVQSIRALSRGPFTQFTDHVKVTVYE